MFVKVIFGSIVIDVLHNPRWVIWASRSKRFLATDPITANGVVSSSGNVYNLKNRAPFSGYPDGYKTVVCEEISEDEYNWYKSQIVSGKEIIEDPAEAEKTEIERLTDKVSELSRVVSALAEVNNSLNNELAASRSDSDAMLVDHEYRLTLVELGVNE